jgi:hypothetical protein
MIYKTKNGDDIIRNIQRSLIGLIPTWMTPHHIDEVDGLFRTSVPYGF